MWYCCCPCVQVYIEGMYEEELPQRAAAADMLCQLFKNSSNMQVREIAFSYQLPTCCFIDCTAASNVACRHTAPASQLAQQQLCSCCAVYCVTYAKVVVCAVAVQPSLLHTRHGASRCWAIVGCICRRCCCGKRYCLRWRACCVRTARAAWTWPLPLLAASTPAAA